MAVFDVSQNLVNGASGVIVGNVRLNLTDLISDLPERLEAMELGELARTLDAVIFRRNLHEYPDNLHFPDLIRQDVGNLPCFVGCAYSDGGNGEP